MKVSELIGIDLDYWVGKAERENAFQITEDGRRICVDYFGNVMYYSTDWAQGGPIIEREGIAVWRGHGKWHGSIPGDSSYPGDSGYIDTDDMWSKGSGPTPLIAAMRAYVASKFGEEVELNDPLTI